MLYYRVTFSGNVRWKCGFGKAAVSLIGFISSWPSRHKTYRRRQPFRSADQGKSPRDVQSERRFGRNLVGTRWSLGDTQSFLSLFGVVGVVASGGASTVTSTSAPGLRRTWSPFSSVSVFSIRISRYR